MTTTSLNLELASTMLMAASAAETPHSIEIALDAETVGDLVRASTRIMAMLLRWVASSTPGTTPEDVASSLLIDLQLMQIEP